jgi:hypothetical protein
VRPWLVSPLAILLLLVPAGTTSAARDCDSKAKLVYGQLARLDNGNHVEKGATIRRGPPFKVERKAKIRFQGASFKVDGRSEFSLSCFGESAAEGAIYPSIWLWKGRAKMIAGAGRPGALVTNEAMAGPVGKAAIQIVAKRRPKSPTSRFGRTWVDRVKGKGYVNLTPYVGPRPGTCRYVDGGIFTSKKLVGGYFRGTAKYRGYSPNSPR